MLSYTVNSEKSNNQLGKLIFRVKATKALFSVRRLMEEGLHEKARRMNHVAKFYHSKAIELGYKSESFLKDFSEVNSFDVNCDSYGMQLRKAA